MTTPNKCPHYVEEKRTLATGKLMSAAFCSVDGELPSQSQPEKGQGFKEWWKKYIGDRYAELFTFETAKAAWNAALSANEKGKDERPRVICLCGSTRFVRDMAIISWEFEKIGNICLGLHLLPDAYWKDKSPVADHLAEHENVKEQMDELHKRKIDISDEIFVVNIGGYIGESTRSEINYAIEHGKKIRYLE